MRPILYGTVLLVAAGFGRAVSAQSGAIQVTADQWQEANGEYDWGTNYGVGLRFTGGERQFRGYGAVDLMPAGGGPFYFLLTAGLVFGPRGERDGVWPYVGLGAACALYYGETYTGGGICGYQGVGGIKVNARRFAPFVELQYSLKTTMKRSSLVVGLASN